MTKENKLYCYFIYAGILPFIICSGLLNFNITGIVWLGNVAHSLNIYSLIIISFIAGSHWGQHLYIQGKWSKLLPLLSNMLAVLLWLAVLVCSNKMLFSIYILAFIGLLWIDWRLLQSGLIVFKYFIARAIVTAIVVILLLSILETF